MMNSHAINNDKLNSEKNNHYAIIDINSNKLENKEKEIENHYRDYRKIKLDNQFNNKNFHYDLNENQYNPSFNSLISQHLKTPSTKQNGQENIISNHLKYQLKVPDINSIIQKNQINGNIYNLNIRKSINESFPNIRNNMNSEDSKQTKNEDSVRKKFNKLNEKNSLILNNGNVPIKKKIDNKNNNYNNNINEIQGNFREKIANNKRTLKELKINHVHLNENSIFLNKSENKTPNNFNVQKLKMKVNFPVEDDNKYIDYNVQTENDNNIIKNNKSNLSSLKLVKIRNFQNLNALNKHKIKENLKILQLEKNSLNLRNNLQTPTNEISHHKSFKNKNFINENSNNKAYFINNVAPLSEVNKLKDQDQVLNSKENIFEYSFMEKNSKNNLDNKDSYFINKSINKNCKLLNSQENSKTFKNVNKILSNYQTNETKTYHKKEISPLPKIPKYYGNNRTNKVLNINLPTIKIENSINNNNNSNMMGLSPLSMNTSKNNASINYNGSKQLILEKFINKNINKKKYVESLSHNVIFNTCINDDNQNFVNSPNNINVLNKIEFSKNYVDKH